MAHPLEDVIRNADRFVLIGHSGEGRFPAYSYHVYTKFGKRFYCLDMGGLEASRGATRGGKVYTSVDALPADRGELAIIWVKPHTAASAVELAHAAGCTRVWFSFGTGHADAVAKAEALGLEVVEIGRCPVYYLADKTPACKAHTLMVKLSGLYQKPPRTLTSGKQREMM